MSRIQLLAVGDTATDCFIHLLPHEAEIDKDPKDHHPLLCMTYGAKIPFEEAIVINGVGNAANAAVASAKLGLKTAFYTNIGHDQVGRDILASLHAHGVSPQYVHIQQGKHSNYHYVLWYGADRTLLIKHEAYDYHWPRFSEDETPEWIYFSSISAHAEHLHHQIADWLETHRQTKLAFQPGTFQIEMGTTKLAKLYRHTEVVACNLEEAQQITHRVTKDPKELMRELHKLGPKIVVVTDGPNGSFASDGTKMYSMRIYPDLAKPYERTGSGDAFTSTFVAALALGQPLEVALKWAPINPASVVQKVGAQAGLLTMRELLSLLRKAPHDYQPKEI